MQKLFNFFVLVVLTISFVQCQKEGNYNQTSNGCPNGNWPVTCSIDPCSLRRPSGCSQSFACIVDYCEGCEPQYFDRNGTQQCLSQGCDDSQCPPIDKSSLGNGTAANCAVLGECVRIGDSCQRSVVFTCACPSLTCTNFCPAGYSTTSDGCPTCECLPYYQYNGSNGDQPNFPFNNCSKDRCDPITCQNNASPYFPEGSCCPVCQDRPCAAVQCPNIDCDFPLYYPSGSCCGVCIQTNSSCSDPINQIPTSFPICLNDSQPILVNKGCGSFWVCQQVLDCSLVRCVDVDCPYGTKKVVAEGDCCGTCVAVPTCDYVSCPQVNCPSSNNLTVVDYDLKCCKQCREIDYCDSVNCAVPNCPRILQVKRAGECCTTCSQCVETDYTTCDFNDDTSCRKGYFTGDNCTDPVQPDDRKVENVTVVVPGDQNDRQVAWGLARQANISTGYINVKVVTSAKRSGTKLAVVTLAAQKSDPIDLTQQKSNLIKSCQQPNSVYAVAGSATTATTDNDVNSAPFVAFSAILICFALLF